MENYLRRSPKSNLTDSDVIDIRITAEAEGLTAQSIADRYNIDRTTAGRIITNRSWSHVPSPKTVGNYSIYPDGRIFSNSNGRFLRTSTAKDGMTYVEMTTNGSRERVSVASLVAKAFLGTKSKNISFINGDTSDTHFTNLSVTKR